MATDKLGLYNDALLLLGQRQLASLTENREPRHRLDGAYTRDAIRYCLELVKPQFATKTALLNTPSAGTTFDYVHTLPADYVCAVGEYTAFSDAKLDQPINRSVIEGKTILVDYDTIYFRYVAEEDDPGQWDASFVRVVGAYLARETATRLSPEEYEKIEAKFTGRVGEARQLETEKVPAKRSTAAVESLTSDTRSLYNEALLLLGLGELTSNDDDSDRRIKLDGAFSRDSIKYCLELIRPQFASKTSILNTPVAGSTFDWTHTLPSDYVSIITPFSDSSLDQKVNRYVIEGDDILLDYETVYLRYISSAALQSAWTPSFTRVMGAYLARETAYLLSPDSYEHVEIKFKERVSEAQAIELSKIPADRSKASNATLTNAWRRVYNDALLIMGLDEITSNTDDSNRRLKLDRVLEVNLVADMLEDTGWQFGQTSVKIEFDPSVEPAWGYQRALGKPSDLHRLDGIYTDEYQRNPLDRYKDEGDFWFCDYDGIFVTYITTGFLVNPDNWPAYFRRLIAARMAKDAAPSLRVEGADLGNSRIVYEERKSSGMSNDAMQSPPHKLAEGNWTKARFRGGYRRRP